MLDAERLQVMEREPDQRLAVTFAWMDEAHRTLTAEREH